MHFFGRRGVTAEMAVDAWHVKPKPVHEVSHAILQKQN